jgi:ATP-binding cassette subfamily B (MDR/TAP) protein 6
LSTISISYFLDGAAFVGFVVYEKVWPRHTGVEINALLGVAAFAGLAALGAWKDVNGAQVWTLRRLKRVVALALLLDLALVVLLGLRIQEARNGELSPLSLSKPFCL